MKKIALFAIAALGVFALASCNKEMESAANGSDVVVTVNADVAFGDVLDQKPYIDDVDGFFFTGDVDVLYWNSESGNASQLIEGDDVKNPAVTMTIPGLAEGDVTGCFSSFDISDPVDYVSPATIVPGVSDVKVAGQQITIPMGTTSLEAKVNVVGAVFRLFPYGVTEGEKVQSVSVCSSDKFAGVATYVPETQSLDFTPECSQVVSVVAEDDQIAVETAAATSYVVSVPSCTITKPMYTVKTNKAYYVFQSQNDKTVKVGHVYDIKLNLANAVKKTLSEIIISKNDISSNDPMQYVVGGSDIYGFDSNKDWFAPISAPQAEARQAKYGLAENLFDRDPSTSYHLNLDWGEVGTSWGQRSDRINSNRYELRYIQIDLPAVYKNVVLDFQNSDSGNLAEGYEIMVTGDGENYQTAASLANGDFGSKFQVYAEGPAQAVRIVNTKSDADWTYIQSAFGIAELVVSTYDDTPSAIGVSSVTLDKSSLTIGVGVTTGLIATVHPDKASDKSVTWSSDDESVAVVADGVVTGIGEGECDVTVTSVDGGKTAVCHVTVTGLPTITVTSAMTNDPMQYVAEGQNTADDCGLNGSPDWFNALTPAHKANREAKYGLADNMFDGDLSTCFHTNLDWGQVGTSWGQRGGFPLEQTERRYIQVEFEASNSIMLWFQNSTSGSLAKGYQIYTSTDGSDFTKFGDPVEVGTFGSAVTVDGIDIEGVKALRIENTSDDSDWTFIKSAFGIAELKIYDKE